MRSPLIAVHAGAGAFGSDLRAHEAELRGVLRELLLAAQTMLERGADALEVVLAAVETMESYELFNAGVGSALCADGSVQMSAAVMRGTDRAAGAVAGIRTARHPILAARAVLESDQVLMAGADADQFAIERGVESCPNRSFVTARQRARLAAGVRHDHGTVGAVCLDAAGGLAAATSTGGITGQPPGRVGDSPLIGSGTWADDRVAVSCTGDGEAFIRAGAARSIALLVAHGLSVGEAAARALADVGRLGGRGGLIVLDAHGDAASPFTSETMPRGLWQAGDEPTVSIEMAPPGA